MKRALVLALGTALVATTMAAPVQLSAQTKAAKAAYKAPRNSLGQPDLGEYWSNASLTPENRPAEYGNRLVMTPEEVKKIEAAEQEEITLGDIPIDPNAPPPSVGGDLRPGQTTFSAAGGNVGGYNRGWLDPGTAVMRVRGEPRTSLITTPTGRAPARKGAPAGAPAAGGRGGGGGPPGAAPGRGGGGGGAGGGGRGGAFDNPETRALGERCIISFGRNGGPPMFANGFYNNNYQFVQSKNAVAIVAEMVHDTRIIRLNDKHRTDGVRPWFGDSIGRWEGDTLVVETTNIPQRQAYNGSWENLTVTEKFTRVAPDRLHYQFIISDPTMWDAPWGGEYEFSALNGRVMEYACHEGNYALEGILAGARNDEAMAARAAGGRAGTQ